MRIYLAGPINGCSDDECRAWREQVKAALPMHTFVDPMARDYRGKEAQSAEAIVEGDKFDILACDALLANCPRPSVGTSMEIFYAWFYGLTVYVVAPEPVSPWLRYHSEALHRTLDEAIASLRGMA